MYPYEQDNQQMYQQYADYWDQGNYDQIPDQEAYHNYRQFVQNASPEIVQQAHEQYYQQMPQEQRRGLLQGLLGGLMHRGITPQQIGLQNTDPSRMSCQDAARVTSYVQQQHPDLLHQIMGPGGPLGSTGAKMLAAGIAAFAAKKMLSGEMRV